MEQEFNDLLKNFENKINLIDDNFEELKKTSNLLVDKLKNEKENNNKIIETFKKYEAVESDIVKLNVGGSLYSTLKSTLTKKILNPSTNQYYKPSILEGLASGYIEPKYDENKAIFIDRNPKYFGYILDYLRLANTENEFEVPDNVDKRELKKEAKYFNIEGLLDLTDTRLLKSVILRSSQVKELLNLCGFSEADKWSLLYRASRDGFSNRDFHSICDNIPKTLTIVRSTNGNIFGGYTNVEWSQEGLYKSDPGAFLFTLINKNNDPLKIKISHGYESYAIYCGTNCGPTFGGGHDLYVSDNSNINMNSYSNLGHTYRHSHLVYGTSESNTLLADSYNFQVSEIEVFVKKN